MPQKSHEEKELDDLVQKQAEYAQQLQRTVSVDATLERWVADGHWDYFQKAVLDTLETEAFRTIKNPDFDPGNISQVAQLKALCQVVDVIKARVQSRLHAVADARAKLLDIERSTPKEGDNGN